MDLGLIKSFLELKRPEELVYLDNSKESNWIRSHYDTYGSLPLPETFERQFSCQLPDLYEDWEYYRTILIDDDFVKKALPILDTFNDDIVKKREPREALCWLRDKLSSVESKQVMSLGASILNSMPSVLEHFKSSSGVRYPTGIKPYDEVSGGVGADDILILTARPGVGKSMMSNFVASNMARMGLRVGFYSSEMSPQSIQARFASFTGGFSNYAITRGRELSAWDDYIDSLVDWEGDFIVLTPADLGGRFATPQDIRAFITSHDLDVMVIDQINGMSLGNRRGGDDWSVLAELQKQLTAIQKSLRIPFIEVLQLSREAAGDNEPELHKIAGSDRFGQDASAVLALWKKAKDIMTIKVLKARDFDGDRLKWEFTVDFDKGKIIQRMDGVSAVKNALQMKQGNPTSDDDLMD